jgi:glycosyltransferase involved in cell wall biosynthesis
LVYYKNLEVIMNAFKEVIKEVPTARLVVLGDGPMREIWTRFSLDLGLGDVISFKGFVSEEEKVKMLHESSMLVFPSTIEGFGFVILEAFASSKPVVASDVEPLTDLIGDGFNGYLANPTDPADWSHKITYLLKHPLEATEMGQNGRRLVETKYSIEANVDSLERLYKRVLEK